MNLTKDTEKAFKIIFCEYKSLRKKGFTKDDSRVFKNISDISAFSSWLSPDIDSAINELLSCKYISKNILGVIKITDEGLKYMENKPREFFNDISKLFDLIAILG